MTRSTVRVWAFWALPVVALVSFGDSFVVHKPMIRQQYCDDRSISTTRPLNLPSGQDGGGEEEFSRNVRLREEVESPFRKVRYFFYLTAAGGASTSLAISIARIAAALAGVNEDLMGESLRNAAIDIAGLVGVYVLYRRDTVAEQSRLQRATKGAALAKLSVRASKRLVDNLVTDNREGSFTTSLASLRRGRGIEKRVIIAVAGKERIAQVLQDAQELQDELELNDLVVVPLVLPQGVAPDLPPDEQPAGVALPVTVDRNWKVFVDEEASDAAKQGVDVENEGFCVILKKNGRVGQRTKGIFLGNLVGNVVARKEAGMDVTNI